MKSSKTDKKVNKKADKNGSSDYLSVGLICLLAGATIATKTLFLVDNDLENKTKFAGENWQLDSQSVQKYTSDIEKFTAQNLNPLGASLSQQSTQLLTRAGDTLADPKNWCVSGSQLATIVDGAKNLSSIDSDRSTSTKPSPHKVVQTSARSNVKGNLRLQPNSPVQSWCINDVQKINW